MRGPSPRAWELWQNRIGKTGPRVDHHWLFPPDGRGAGFGPQDTKISAIRVWDAATGRPLVRLDGHNRLGMRPWHSPGMDGRLISAASDQFHSFFWDTDLHGSKPRCFRGPHPTRSMPSPAITGPGQLLASTGKDGRPSCCGKTITKTRGRMDTAFSGNTPGQRGAATGPFAFMLFAAPGQTTGGWLISSATRCRFSFAGNRIHRPMSSGLGLAPTFFATGKKTEPDRRPGI